MQATERAEKKTSGEEVKRSRDLSKEDAETVRKSTIEYIRSLGRISLNDLTSDNIRQLEKFAKRYKKMKVKSPFFKAWFGDWRANDNTKISYVEVNSDFIEKSDIPTDDFYNSDTEWTITTNSDGKDETSNKNGKWSVNYRALKDIEDMLKNAVLLDTVTISSPSKKLGNSAIFMHHLYCPVKLKNNGRKGIAKLYVAETFEGSKKFYLNKIEMSPDTMVSTNVGSTWSNSSASDDTVSVSQIFDFVKQHDVDYEKDSKHPVYFNPKPSSLVVDKDGKPKKVYHGTNSDFDIFKSSDGTYWFSESYDYAESMAEERGGNIVKEYFLNMKNPYKAKLPEGQFSDPTFEKPIINKAKAGGYDGVIIETDTDNELVYDKFYVVFDKTQIKSATDNIGTFDGDNANTKMSKDLSELEMSESKITALAGKLRGTHSSTYDKAMLINDLKSIYGLYKEEKYSEGNNASLALAKRIVDARKAVRVVDEGAKDILRNIRSKRIRLNEHQISEAKRRFGNLWRDRFMGRVTFSKNGNIYLDSQWQEWAELYPEWFKADVNSTDMVNRLYDILEDLKKASEYREKAAVDDKYVYGVTKDIMDGIFGSGIERKNVRPSKEEQNKVDELMRDWSLKRWGADVGRTDSGEGISIDEAIKKVKESFGINVTSGGDASVSGNVVGSYNVDSKTIRTKFKNDLPSITHALGYHIDARLGIVDEVISQTDAVRGLNGEGIGEYEMELLRLAPENAPDSKKKIQEGFSEFIRMYLTSKPLAMEAAPIFYSYFESQLSTNEELLNAVEESARIVSGYFAQSASERAGAAVMTAEEWKKLNAPKGKQKADELRRWVITRLFDRFYGIKSAEKRNGVFDLSTSKNAYIRATLSLGARGRSARLLEDGFYDSNGNKVGEAFFDIIAPLGANYSDKFKAFDNYLAFVHAIEWIEPNNLKGKKTSSGKDIYNAKAKGKVFADDSLNDANELRRIIADYEREYPEFKSIANKIYKYQDNLMEYYLIPSGALSRDQAETFRAQYPHYVPFNRFNTVFGEATNSGKKGTQMFANLSNPIKKADGGNAPIRSVLESVMNSTFKAVDFYMKNDTMHSLISEFTGTGSIPGVMERVYSTKELEKLNEKGQNPFITEEGVRIDESSDAAFNPTIDKEKGIVHVWVDGEKRFYQVYDRDLYSAVANLEVQNLRGFFKVFNSINNVMKVTMTMRNPLFAPGNFFRDFMTFHYNTTSEADILSQLGMYAGALKSVLAKDENYQLYKALGGMDSGQFRADTDVLKGAIRDRNTSSVKWSEMSARDFGEKVKNNVLGLKYLWDKYFELNDIFETLPRLAEFKSTLKQTGDVQLSMYRAQDVTTNFSRSGSWGRNINSIFLFSNAELQGIDKMVRNYTEAAYEAKDKSGNPVKARAAARVLKTVGWSLFMTALSEFINRRDEEAEEEYRRLSEFTKNNYDVFYIANGYFVKLPKDQNLAMPRTSMQRIFDAVRGDGFDFKEFGGYIWDGITPDFIPDIFDIKNAPQQILNNTPIGSITDVAFNRDYKGDEIVPSYMTGPEYLKYNNYTNALSVNFARNLYKVTGMDVSPMALDHYFSAAGYYGTLFKNLLPVIDVEEKGVWGSIGKNALNALGVKTKFRTDARYSTDLLDDFYEGQDNAKKRMGLDDNGENRLVSEKYAVMESFIKSYNKLSRSGSEEAQRLDRKMLQIMLEGFDEGDISEGERYVIDLYNETGNDDVFVSSFPGPEIKDTSTKKGVKTITTANLDANLYAEYCADIESAREKVRVLVKNLGLEATAAAEFLSKEYRNINADIKEKYLEKYGTTTQEKFVKQEKADTGDYETLYNRYLDEIIQGN